MEVYLETMALIEWARSAGQQRACPVRHLCMMARSTSITIRLLFTQQFRKFRNTAVSAASENQMVLPPNSDICQNTPGTTSTHWKASADPAGNRLDKNQLTKLYNLECWDSTNWQQIFYERIHTFVTGRNTDAVPRPEKLLTSLDDICHSDRKNQTSPWQGDIHGNHGYQSRTQSTRKSGPEHSGTYNRHRIRGKRRNFRRIRDVDC